MSNGLAGVSFVVPVYNAGPRLEACLLAILSLIDDIASELIVVDDGSGDDSLAVVERMASQHPHVRPLAGAGRGLAACLNLAISQARFPLIAQIDQDVVVEEGWLAPLLQLMDAMPKLAAAQGVFIEPANQGIWASAMAIDLKQRYQKATSRTFVDHVCTGNVLYRKTALLQVGGFDDTLGYGLDNDMSYRLTAAGFDLVISRDAKAVHYWRRDLSDYLIQQYGVGYGRLDLLSKHPRRLFGDDVSGPGMMIHAAAMTVALILVVVGGHLAAIFADGPPIGMLLIAGGVLLLGAMLVERFVVGVSAAIHFKERVALLFPAVHLMRNVAWAAAIAVWHTRRLFGRPRLPQHSMWR